MAEQLPFTLNDVKLSCSAHLCILRLLVGIHEGQGFN